MGKVQKIMAQARRDDQMSSQPAGDAEIVSMRKNDIADKRPESTWPMSVKTSKLLIRGSAKNSED